MESVPGLELLCALIGLAVGAVVVFVAPRLVAYRLSEPPPPAPAAILLPLAGAWLSGYRPARALAVQVTLALVFVALAVHYGPSKQLILACVYSVLLFAIAAIDLDHRLVLNRLSYPGLVLALLGALVWPGLGWQRALAGAAVGLVLFAALEIMGRGRLGTGDTKLALLIGAMRGFPAVFDALLVGVLLGGVGAAVALSVLRRGRKEYIPYAPFLAAGAIVSFFLTSP